MHSAVRRIAALLGALVIVTLAAPSATAATLEIDELRLGRARVGAAGSAVGVSPAPCADGKYNLIGAKWRDSEYRWAFHAASTPSYLTRKAVRNVLIRSFSNITNARNDCGLADNVSATHAFLGKTAARPRCGDRDGRNVVGFGRLERGVLGVTCFWRIGDRMIEADVIFNTRERWALTTKGCVAEPMLEATATHEAGHVFGVDHVGERRHGRLTMSTYLDGPCQNGEATLGLGDVRALEALY